MLYGTPGAPLAELEPPTPTSTAGGSDGHPPARVTALTPRPLTGWRAWRLAFTIAAGGKTDSCPSAGPGGRVDVQVAGDDEPLGEQTELVLAQAALEGLEDLAAGRLLNEAELDQLLSVLSNRARKGKQIE